ncbi:MAG TPA: DUF2298 domain-containing protein, partial [Baekduia sp.]|nr:DUF2298 domain-containing protein [Baekduia sp.]
WLSGSSLNYYYFGHYLIAWLIRLTGSDPAVGYNAAVALTFGVTAAAVFGVTASLASFVGGERTSPRRLISAGLLGVAFAMLLGTLATVGELEHARHSLLGFRWWQPSRVIPHTANDFPFYSVLLGDLHAHVIAVPFSLLLVAFAINLAARGPRLPSRTVPGRTVAAATELVLAALVLGALAATNSFAAPAAVAIGVGGALIWGASSARWAAALIWIGVWAAVAFLLFLPFVLRFHPGTHGIGLVNTHSSARRFVWNEFLVYGALAGALAPLYVLRLRRLSLSRRQAVPAVAASIAVLTLAVVLGAGVALLVAVALAVGWHAAIDEHARVTERCLWLVVALGATAALIGELVYVRDVFDSGPDYRFNTVFKFGYQAWYLLAVGAAVTVATTTIGRTSWPARAWLAAVIALGVAAAVYPLAGSYSASAGFATNPTLDGVRWLKMRSPDDLAAIQWIQANVRGQPTILEATGADYDPLGHGRVSVFTGLPTVLGWLGHELQWNHRPGNRWDDVHTIYATESLPEARRLLDRYRVRYVFAGSLEERDYPGRGLAKFARLGKAVFVRGRTRVYRVDPVVNGS